MRWGLCSWSLRHWCVPVFIVRRCVQAGTLWYCGGDNATVFWSVCSRQMGWPWGDKQKLSWTMPTWKVEPRWLRLVHVDLAHSESNPESNPETYSEAHCEDNHQAHAKSHSETHQHAHTESHQHAHADSHQHAHAKFRLQTSKARDSNGS